MLAQHHTLPWQAPKKPVTPKALETRALKPWHFSRQGVLALEINVHILASQRRYYTIATCPNAAGKKDHRSRNAHHQCSLMADQPAPQQEVARSEPAHRTALASEQL